jgi:outer membrane protein insertion porin family
MIVTLNNALKSVRQVTLPDEVRESSALSMSITFTPIEYVKSGFELRSVFIEGALTCRKEKSLDRPVLLKVNG